MSGIQFLYFSIIIFTLLSFTYNFISLITLKFVSFLNIISHIHPQSISSFSFKFPIYVNPNSVAL